MPTDKQIAASRRNGRKSQGPKTSEGKFRSALNSLRHGAYATHYILSTEDPKVFRNFANDLVNETRPNSAAELEIVDQMICNAWHRRRLSALLTQRVNNAIDQLAKTESLPVPELNVRAYELLETEKPSFAHQELLELRFGTAFQRSLARLQSSRAYDAKMSQNQAKRRNEPSNTLTPLARAA